MRRFERNCIHISTISFNVLLYYYSQLYSHTCKQSKFFLLCLDFWATCKKSRAIYNYLILVKAPNEIQQITDFFDLPAGRVQQEDPGNEEDLFHEGEDDVFHEGKYFFFQQI